MPRFILADESWGPGMYTFQCPGCECCHYVRTEQDPELKKKDVWQWNGNVDKPTVTPSLHIFDNERTRCHLFITDGNLRFLNDCDHELKGQVVPMLEWEDDAKESPSDS